MHFKRSKTDPDDASLPVPEQTKSVLNNAIVNIVQAIGSRAGVLTFWDEAANKPGQTTSYGLTPSLLNEIGPVITDLMIQLEKRVHSADLEPDMLALQRDVPTQLGSLHLICLPIQTDGRFIAGLCLLQPSSTISLGLDEIPLPMIEDGAGVIPSRAADEPEQAKHGLMSDQGEVVARNARLLKRLVEERQWLAAVIEYSADGILIVDSNCNIIGFNPAFARLSGWNADELRGQNCYEALKLTATKGEAYCGKLCALKMGAFANRPAEDRRSEVVLTTKSGEQRYVELSYSVILADDGRILGSILGARDITARKEAEELQSTFLSVISHELQTPIAIIKGYAGLYADETTPIDPVRVREKMQIIEEESTRLSKLVENLLYASRLQAGGIQLNRQPVEMASLLRKVANKLRDVSRSHKIGVALSGDELPAVLGDYDKIQQVLVNLVENAIKYSPKGGPIVLSAEYTSQEVVVSVTDNGMGIPASERQRVFDRFSRLDSRYVRERKGAGLGLYICKAIVEAHGGTIWVEDAPGVAENSNVGSRFNFTLPREEPANLPVLFNKV